MGVRVRARTSTWSQTVALHLLTVNEVGVFVELTTTAADINAMAASVTISAVMVAVMVADISAVDHTVCTVHYTV